MNNKDFFSNELIIENDFLVLRPLNKSDIGKIRTISFTQELENLVPELKMTMIY